MMEIYPAVDIRGGRCVRLLRGDFGEEQVFSEDPVSVAVGWRDAGAPLVHVVDLDGARDGGRPNEETVRQMIRLGVPVQLGGGIRAFEDARIMLEAGVQRVVIGTAAIEDPALRRELLARYGEKVVVGLDCREGRVATRGWLRQLPLEAAQLAGEILAEGGTRVLLTDIGRDGTLEGPNIDLLEEVLATGIEVIASGGVGTLEDIRSLARVAAENSRLVGAIVGKALYVGAFDLPGAQGAVEEEIRCWQNG